MSTKSSLNKIHCNVFMVTAYGAGWSMFKVLIKRAVIDYRLPRRLVKLKVAAYRQEAKAYAFGEYYGGTSTSLLVHDELNYFIS